MSKVLLLDTTKEPLDPVHPGRARLLLKEGKAAVYRRYPFTLILKTKVDAPVVSALRLKLDPGAKTSGLALVDDASGEVVWAAELTHRGEQIKRDLGRRRAVRRKRRQRKTRYRKPRCAPRHAAMYLPGRGKELEGRFLGLMAYLDAKARGDSSLPGKQRSCSGV